MRLKHYSLLFLLVFLVAAPCFAGEKLSANPRIVGGEEAEKGAWPWIVALYDDIDQFCGGTLVTPEWVITAAQCTEDMTADEITIRYGFNSFTKDPVMTVAVDRIVDHPGYDPVTIDNDLSLLHLSTPITGQNVISLVSQDDPQSLYTTDTVNLVAGWGLLSFIGGYTDDLMQVMVPTYDFDEANSTYSQLGSEFQLTQNMFAAGYAKGGRDACYGDSGGPLITSNSGDWKLTGVVSWGEGCGIACYPGVYTRLGNYREWIEENIPELAYSTYLFNARSYLDANPDLTAQGVTLENALSHYARSGKDQGLQKSFIPKQYLDANPDLVDEGVTLETALDHYLTIGKDHGRLAQFNADEYMRANPDLSHAGITEETALNHYMNYGKYEHRALFFNSAEYLAANPGLSDAGVTFENAAYHYLAYGRNEGRFLAFDGKAYMELNPELANYGWTAKNAIDHYLYYGQAEGRAYVGVRAEHVEMTDPVTGMEFVWVPGGSFYMGSKSGFEDQQPRHKVTIDGFWMGKYEVTQKQWVAIMGSNPSSYAGDLNPVETVSWDDVQGYITALNSQGGNTFLLPTEAQWEYACRAGTATEYYWGDTANADEYAWYDDNSGNTTHPVGQKEPNLFGLYDMSGNVWEWVGDWYSDTYYAQSPQENPTGPESGEFRVLRGESQDSDESSLRCANRGGFSPDDEYDCLGVRLVIQP